ncbi:MAG: DUF4157 domain-containing protein [Cytophagales bacterium]|uniref:DUF4157 domain-containing protein n=1 Tax=Algoriphagus taiwanensis TaxID=1445656 RepID=A0ABQ6Q0Q2_9BACT|nr:MAG: DUF4157 domain-containing protein [Cytophagales bacterium]GMQ33770.1 hypothetical protein Ataiwa_20420 [Algoriphagus taiwanensis]
MGAVAEKLLPPSPALHVGARIQPALKVGKPNDKFEKEAESVANQVMMMPDSSSMPLMTSYSSGIQRENEEEEEVQMRPLFETISRVALQPEEEEEVQMSPFAGGMTRISLQAEEDEEVQMQTEEEEEVQMQAEEEEEVQMKAEEEEEVQLLGMDSGSREVTPALSTQIQSATGGSPLPGPVQSEMGAKIGADFSSVKVHTGSQATQMSEALGAQAFTHGGDIFFNEGKYQPDTPKGKHLLAHELTHTVQQGAAVQRSPKPEVSSTKPQVQRLPYAVREGLSRFASYIPGYTLLCVIIGYDPLAGRNVERNATNLLGGLLGLIPVFGTLLFNKLVELGITQSAMAWVEGEMQALNLTTARLERTLEQAWDEASLFSSWDENMAVLDRTFGQLYRDVVTFAGRVKEKIFELIKEALMTALKALADSFPGYPLLVKLLGKDPLTGEEVSSTTAEKIEAFLLLIGKEQELERMKAEGTIQETADWIDTELAALNFSFEEIKNLFDEAWNAFSLDDLRDPPAAFRRTIAIFEPFTTRVFTFAANVALKVLEFIKNALLAQLSAYAREQQGYPLITVILGKDPFTGEEVPRSTENLIHGFMSLLPGGEEQFQQMQQTGAIARMTAKVDAAVASLNFSWEYITGLFLTLWNSFTIQDVFHPLDAFIRIVQTLAAPIQRLIAFVVTIVQIVVEVLLVVMNFPIETIQQIIANAQSAFEDIKRDPIGFLKNLLAAVKQGFVQFFNNIVTHLLGGLRDWLFGELASAGINPPADLSFQSILGFVLDTLGLTIDNVWERLALKIGEERVAQIRGAIDQLTGIWTFIKDVWERGPIAIWEYVQEQLSNLWNLVLEQIQGWIMTRIVEQVVGKLLAMLDPTGIMAVINSFIAFYRAVQSFIEKLREMLDIVNSFVAGVANIARGSIAVAANFLESALARAIPVAIGFLANQVGLRGLGTKIAEMIGALREKINGAIDWLIDKALAAGGALLNLGKKAASSALGWVKQVLGLEKRFEAKDKSKHRIFFKEKEGKPQLMLNPDPASPLKDWLDNLQIDAATKAKAEGVVSKIEAEYNKPITATDENAIKDEERAKAKAIGKLMDELTLTLKSIFDSSSASVVKPQFGTLRGEYGTWMKVERLGSPNAGLGSSPSVSEGTNYEMINKRKRGSGSYYVKGHLLNEKLGGTGKQWENLTPLNRRANGDHERIAEKRVKKATAAGALVNYFVEVIYGRSAPTNLNNPPSLVDQIKEAETEVPSKLICEAEIITPAVYSKTGKEEVSPLIPKGTTILNDIDRDAYEV